MSSIVLISAVLASLAIGVLLAYGICLGMFRIFRMHSMQAAQQRAVQRATASLQASSQPIVN